LKFHIRIICDEQYMRGVRKGRNREHDSHMAFARSVTAVYGLNLALSYENAAAGRLEQRASQCIVPEVKKNLARHLKQTREQQERLKERMWALAGSSDAATPTAESGRLPVPEPPRFLKDIMDEVGTEREREVWESVNDLIVERAEAIMYRAGIQALELLGADKKTIGALKKNLQEEEAFAKWLEKNNPRIAKRLMKEQMREGKKKRIAGVKADDEEAAAADKAVATTA
jgi:ferritin-like metal-binding protein YciE